MEAWLAEVDSQSVIEMFQGLNHGKMLRSKLILAIAGEEEALIRLCAVVELIQVASLLHDDVIDDSQTRRGRPSINATFGAKSAIMLGDILYAKAFCELTSFAPEVARVVAGAVVKLSRGELHDVLLSRTFNTQETLYSAMIDDKTASLIEASSEAAAILAKRDREAFRVYGKNLGLAFQIVDDILDVTQASETLGKPAMSDFAEGKATLPYIYLYHALDEQGKARLRGYFGRTLEEEDVAWVREAMEYSGALKRSREEAKSLGSRALDAIKNERCEVLETMVKQILEREF